MKFEQLDSELPNGFHDARLHKVAIDYPAGSMILHMDLWVGRLDGGNREEYRSAEVRVTGLYFCVVDPPDPSCPYVPSRFPLDVSGDPAKPDTFPALNELSRTFPPGLSCYRFFVHEWNSFINIAARDVQISWINDGGQQIHP